MFITHKMRPLLAWGVTAPGQSGCLSPPLLAPQECVVRQSETLDPSSRGPTFAASLSASVSQFPPLLPSTPALCPLRRQTDPAAVLSGEYCKSAEIIFPQTLSPLDYNLYHTRS